MCLIVVHPKGKAEMPQWEFRDAFRTHSDGGGIMFSQGGAVKIWKPYWSVERMWKAYQRAQVRADGPVVLHFRWKTHGRKDAKNTHPHSVAKGKVGFVHNGILPVKWPKGGAGDNSDTVVWAREVFGDVDPKAIFGGAILAQYNTLLGGNKLVFLDGEGNTKIVGEKAGWWIQGLWYSNRTHVWRSFEEKVPAHWKLPLTAFKREETAPPKRSNFYIPLYDHDRGGRPWGEGGTGTL